MRGLILIAVLVHFAIPAFAARRITVKQLRSILLEQKETKKKMRRLRDRSAVLN